MSYLVAAAIVLTASLAVAQTDASARPQHALERLVAKNKGFGGGVLRIGDSHGLVWEGAAGLTGGAGSAPMTPETPFEVASITKAVTAATILRLVEEGKLELDSRLADIFPGEQARGFCGDITVRQLLSHTSGLADYWGDHEPSGRSPFLKAFLAAPGRHWKPEEILAYARELPSKRPPAKFRYSDTNYVLLGQAIERVTKLPLHRAFSEMVFHPLGMDDTWLTYHEKQRGKAPAHRFEGCEDLHAVERQSADWAGGGLMSTTRDLERFLSGLASGRLFKSPGTLEVMRKAVPTGEDSVSYGLGLFRVDLGGGRGELWGHDGHGNSFAYFWPERGIYFTGTLNQTKNDWWPLVEACVDEKKGTEIAAEAGKTFEVSLSAGWDSLYMFRGVNALRDGGRYGAGIAWADLNVTWSPTDEDSLSADLWHCLSTHGAAYREFDASLAYTRTLGDLSLTAGYSFYFGYAPQNFFSHELSAVAAYELAAGPATITPSLSYYFNIGPDSGDGQGFAKSGSSFLLFRVDGHLPVFRKIVALEPWGALGMNFQYNARTGSDGEPVPFSGANNLEFGLSVPFKITRSLTVSGYAAYSRALAGLAETSSDTFWGGGSVTVSF
ncbi:MAG: serine hydrolase domain-containing protein [Verrucomicrobiae bacterium]